MNMSKLAAAARSFTMQNKECIDALNRMLPEPREKFRGMNQRQRRKRERQGRGGG